MSQESSSEASWNAVALITISLMSNLLYGGIVYGWPSFQLLLEDENILRPSDCVSNIDDHPCFAQANNIMLLYTIASTVSAFFCLPSGYLMDILGPFRTTLIALVMVISGLFFVGIAPTDNFPLLSISITIMTCGGGLLFSNSFLVGFVIPKPWLTTYMTSTNCLYDASTVMFFIVYKIYSMGISRKVIFIVYSCIALLMLSTLAFLWYLMEPQLNAQKSEIKQTVTSTKEAEVEIVALLSDDSNMNGTTQSYEEGNNDSSHCDNTSQEQIHFHNLSLQQQLQSNVFRFLAIICAINLLKSNSYMGLARDLLQRYDDADTGNFYTQLFSVVLPLGFVFIPVIDLTMKRWGFVASFDTITVLGLIFPAISMIPCLSCQSIAFLVFCAFRALFYSTCGTFITNSFGPINVGRIYGFAYFIAAVANFSAWPLQLMTTKLFHGDYSVSNALMIAMSIPLFVATHCLLKPLIYNDIISDVKEKK